MIFTFVKTITGDLFTISELPFTKMSITLDILALYKIIWTYLSRNAKQLFQMSKQFKMKVYKFSNSTIFDNQEAVIIQNLFPILENCIKIHKIHILKCAPKVSKRKTRLLYIANIPIMNLFLIIHHYYYIGRTRYNIQLHRITP